MFLILKKKQHENDGVSRGFSLAYQEYKMPILFFTSLSCLLVVAATKSLLKPCHKLLG